MTKYEVGQVLFILAGANKGILPVQVCEEIVRKTAGGTTIDYMVNFPDRDEPVNLKIANNKVFVTEADVKAHMMSNTEIAIDRLLVQARSIAKTKFNYTTTATTETNEAAPAKTPRKRKAVEAPLEPEPEPITPEPTLDDMDGTTLQLEDGSTARIHLPPEFQDLVGTGSGL